jgi:RNA polymerase sigma-70 factor (ECF subfamily)
MADTDRSLVGRCLDGHSEDFRHLVQRYQHALVAHLRMRLRDRVEAEDAAQDTLVRAFFSLSKLRQPDSFFPWLLGIADHVVQETRRRQRTEGRHIAGDETQACGVAAGETDPADAAALELAVAALAAPFRDVVLLRFYGGCSCAEIAERLDVPIGTVTKRLSRAYAELRQRLGA